MTDQRQRMIVGIDRNGDGGDLIAVYTSHFILVFGRISQYIIVCYDRTA